MTDLCLAQEPEADALLARDPLALLIGMVLDQQIPLEWAFKGPLHVAAAARAVTSTRPRSPRRDPDALAAVFATPPALHRFPGSMAGRVQELCRVIVDDYDGDAAAVWTDADGRRRAAASGSRRCPASASRRRRSSSRCSASSSACGRRAGARRRASSARPRAVQVRRRHHRRASRSRRCADYKKQMKADAKAAKAAAG